MIRHSIALAILLCASFVAPFAVAEERSSARVGVLVPNSAPSLNAFTERLQQLGWVGGANLAVEMRRAERPAELRRLAAELVASRVDAIVAFGTPATRAAKAETSTIPIVMVGVGNALDAGFVKSLSMPGGNVTGTSFLGPELALKEFDLLMEALPRTRRVSLVFNPDIQPRPLSDSLSKAARAKDVLLEPLALRPGDNVDAVARIGAGRPDALLVFAVADEQLDPIVAFARTNRFPAVYGFKEAVERGGLMSYGPRTADLWRVAAQYVDRILRGARPEALPVEQPTTFELVVNLRTARMLGLGLPAPLLLRADQTIE